MQNEPNRAPGHCAGSLGIERASPDFRRPMNMKSVLCFILALLAAGCAGPHHAPSSMPRMAQQDILRVDVCATSQLNSLH